jgi:hypothetical protein
MLWENQDGEVLEMADGSAWKIINSGSATPSIWLPSDDIEICGNTLRDVDDADACGDDEDDGKS